MLLLRTLLGLDVTEDGLQVDPRVLGQERSQTEMSRGAQFGIRQ